MGESRPARWGEDLILTGSGPPVDPFFVVWESLLRMTYICTLLGQIQGYDG